MIKVGLILECGPGGPDEQIYRHLAQALIPKIKLSCETMVDKPKLVADCGKVAARLLAVGCERVGIVWDLFPKWRVPDEQHCLGQDRDEIAASLDEAKVGAPRVQLVCVQEELEAWLLADSRALTAFFSRPAHPAKKMPEFKRPEGMSNPKGHLRKLFNKYLGKHRRYNEMVDAFRIFQNVQDWERLKRCPSFVRFVERVLGGNV
jgi:hypothetical protein